MCKYQFLLAFLFSINFFYIVYDYFNNFFFDEKFKIFLEIIVKNLNIDKYYLYY